MTKRDRLIHDLAIKIKIARRDDKMSDWKMIGSEILDGCWLGSRYDELQIDESSAKATRFWNAVKSLVFETL